MAQLLPNGVYAIRSAQFEDRVVDLSDGMPIPNTPIIGWHYHKGENQHWELTSVNDANLYVIKSKISAGTSHIALSDLRIYPPRIASQPFYEQWSIEPVGEGLFRMHHMYTDGAITLMDEKEGSQLCLNPWEGFGGQKWRFESV